MEDNSIHVSMLGDCSISYKGSVIDSTVMRSKKIWSLLQYLIYYRNRDISKEQLLELVYLEGDSSNPQNALKTLMHRCRSVLENLGYADSKLMIVQHAGSYKWNPALPLVLDAERFDELYSCFAECKPGSSAAYSACCEALELYKGCFLEKTASPWAAPLRERYQERYLQLVRAAIDMMSQREAYDELVRVCSSALQTNRYDETLYLTLMSSLIKQGKPNIAMSVYERATKIFFNELGVTPSDELQSIYRQIVRSTQNVELDINVISDKLREDPGPGGAFLCEYEFFKDIYRLEVRSALRTGKPGHICLLTIISPSEKPLTPKAINHTMEKLIGIVEDNLRRGDVFSRYSVCQLILLLPLTNAENALQVAERILNAFNLSSPHPGSTLAFSVKALEPTVFSENTKRTG